jgi:hypothetical protein
LGLFSLKSHWSCQTKIFSWTTLLRRFLTVLLNWLTVVFFNQKFKLDPSYQLNVSVVSTIILEFIWEQIWSFILNKNWMNKAASFLENQANYSTLPPFRTLFKHHKRWSNIDLTSCLLARMNSINVPLKRMNSKLHMI